MGYILKQAQHGLRTRMDQNLRALGLSTAQYALLVALQDAKVASGADLARRCFVTPQTVTGLISGLVQAGFVVRSASSSHGRIIEARLTPTGRDILRRANRIVYAIEEDMLADLSESDRAALGRMLRVCALRLGGRSTDLDEN
ncbi:MarR family transcriptional regulator [Sphingopyxis indica]|uniref:MarR family winged helix-turn-helix transcriptional regulator n=1 Tax=Sphingopyxis indica TaxID=436663 RepID=UPI00293931D6|nr:MarR family transcriptional regulator [Sphingopyxis indica]WOF45001.1 MarR family transcriptional regulator [Sphingopyxis indica]